MDLVLIIGLIWMFILCLGNAELGIHRNQLFWILMKEKPPRKVIIINFDWSEIGLKF